MNKKNTKSVRLPQHIIPEKYIIHLIPDLDKFVFEGEEEIALLIKKSTTSITIHSAELEILFASLSFPRKRESRSIDEPGSPIKSGMTMEAKISYSDKDETATFTFPQEVKPGRAVLKLKFTGILNDKLRGFYRSRYEVDKKAYHMAVTQFESTDARRAFPCFDEPAQKAIFEVSLKIPSDRTLISNTVETETLEHESGLKTIKFAPTPKMSSYLLAFIVGHFEHIEKVNADGVLVRVFTTPGKKKQAEFALDVAGKVLSFYTKYFNISYPLPTLDLIAIPDFAAGAMENWGAVTYRESALLVDADLSSIQNKQWVALVVAHELAHQWFGNLVTMEWWTHLWLNEGFASYMEYVAVDKLFPKWKVWSQFVFLDHARALSLDGLASTHPIEVEVNNPAEISEIFDEVSYSKGASVIRMLAEYLGEKDFRNGLRFYLKKHKYGNAATTDLWSALEKISGKPVGKIMEAWTAKPGYPVVSFTEKNGEYVISQKRFFASSKKKNKIDDSVWPIPINILTPSSKAPAYYLLKTKEGTLPARLSRGAFVKLNARETSFMRVNYGSYLESLEAPIQSKNKSFRPSDRFGIVRDAFALSQAGHMPLVKVLKIVLSYQEEESYIVWAEIATNLIKLGSLLSEEKYLTSYNNYVISAFKRIGKHLGWEKRKDESHSHTLLRSTVLFVLGKNKHQPTIAKAKELFNLENAGKIKIDSDIRGVVYNLVAENGSEKEYKIFLSKFKVEKLEEERDRFLRAMCLFPDKTLLQSTLDLAFSDETPGQDAVKAINMVFANRFGREIAWKYLRSSWKNIVKQFGGGHLFTRFVKSVDNFTTYQKADEVKEFFGKNMEEGIGRTVDQVIETIESSAAWLERDGDDLKKFLSQFE